MTRLAAMFAMFLSLTAPHAWAEGTDMTEAVIIDGLTANLAEFKWTHRPLIVFADSPYDPAFVRQMELIEDDLPALVERDVVVLTDTDPSARSALRSALHPRGFGFVLVGKDGGIKLRKPSPWTVREISRTIDKMPMRQQEIRESR
ncbi:DUF4174 domain-containing protein [Donghicola sp. C2-DW-16]|uniref:DUF4174 domain-containing protein n=1 Tax=Donghicola mangrovi TaxID=2729614 RepID=A0A850Q8W0_9RHOB|nr:DUF4174 domain-containing protein [Donghicola mangrovi]NVO23408.1 DUF4174 domain-containing protein [Donghicola mangrovi]NVO27134.1 DUF4174 domain-containing protein [Donghicola mangrovi]